MSLKAWRNQVLEDVIEPDLPIIDAHHHLWTKSPNPIFEEYAPEAMAADISSSRHNVVATVYGDSHSHYWTVGPEHLRYAGETEYAETVAEARFHRVPSRPLFCAGIVGRADLQKGAATTELLHAHLAASPHRFKGVRQRISHDADYPFNEPPGLMERTDFREGFGQLAGLGLSFDTCLVHPQIPELTNLARTFPETSIILNHIGGPLMRGRFAGRYAEVFNAWSSAMADLATCDNVSVKLGGMNMEHTGLSFVGRERPPTSEEAAMKQREFALRVIDLFGPDRCMFESNFPVDMLGISYGVLWNMFKRLTSDFTSGERHALFFETANRVYRLNLQL